MPMDDIAHAVIGERRALATTLRDVGPDAPTLVNGWTAADVAAHVLSLDRFQGLPTFVGRTLVARWALRLNDVAGRFADGSSRSTRRKGFDWAVTRLTREPPALLLRPSVAPVGLFEVFVHHEDIRRAGGPSEARVSPAELHRVIPWLSRYQRKVLPPDVQLLVRPDDAPELSIGQGAEVILSGPSPELVLWLAGRKGVADAALTGDARSCALVEQAPVRV